MSAPTEKELELLPIFRMKIADLYLEEEQRSDQHLLRWIRAREYNLGKAEEMLRKHLDWREINEINAALLDWKPPSFLTENYKAQFSGFDHQGCPVLIFTFGKWDVRKILDRGEKIQMIKYKDQVIEKVMELMKAKKKNVTQFNCIADMEGFSLKYILHKEALETILESVRSFEANYPETLKAAYTVNTPRVFAVLFNLIKPLLTGRTLSKIFIYDSNTSNWQSEILKTIPASQVPIMYGGSKVKTFKMHEDFWEDFAQLASDPDLEDDDFLQQGIQLDLDVDAMKDSQEIAVRVAPGEKLFIPKVIDKENSKLGWNFRVEDKDVAFSIVLEEDREEIVKSIRTSAHSGCVICSIKGKYSLIFDNSYSNFKAKMVHYKVYISQ